MGKTTISRIANIIIKDHPDSLYYTILEATLPQILCTFVPHRPFHFPIFSSSYPLSSCLFPMSYEPGAELFSAIVSPWPGN
jgi:hypothetical protein